MHRCRGARDHRARLPGRLRAERRRRRPRHHHHDRPDDDHRAHRIDDLPGRRRAHLRRRFRRRPQGPHPSGPGHHGRLRHAARRGQPGEGQVRELPEPRRQLRGDPEQEAPPGLHVRAPRDAGLRRQGHRSSSRASRSASSGRPATPRRVTSTSSSGSASGIEAAIRSTRCPTSRPTRATRPSPHPPGAPGRVLQRRPCCVLNQACPDSPSRPRPPSGCGCRRRPGGSSLGHPALPLPAPGHAQLRQPRRHRLRREACRWLGSHRPGHHRRAAAPRSWPPMTRW